MGKTIHIEFPYKNLIHMIDIPVDHIDINHYDTLWDWWFGLEDRFPSWEEDFEITGEKSDFDTVTVNGIYINVYADTNADHPFLVIENVKARIS